MLSIILWLPLAFAITGLAFGRRAGWWAVAGSLATLGVAIGLFFDGFDELGKTGEMQYIVDQSWIPELGVRYSLGVDGLSIGLLILTALMWAAATIWSALRSPERAGLYFLMLGIGETAVLGAFMAQDLLLFVLFFDLMLIPFYFLVGIWGSGDRRSATLKMLIYTLVGSLLMLVGAIAAAVLAADGGTLSFALTDLRQNLLSEGTQQWIFCLFAAAFLVKMPAFLVHGWMPDAYRSCPLPVLVLLSGVLSKVAAYGFLRIVFPIFPEATVHFQELILVIATASILYGSAMAFTQTNIRMIAGFSSVAQMGFITLGIFSLTAAGADGAVLQMINHGIVAGAAFLVIAVLYERFGTEELTEMGGMAKRAPILAALFLVITMATLAMPGSANFIGEFYILAGVFEAKIAFAFIAAIGIALAAFYALRMYQRSMHNQLPEGIESREVGFGDGLVLSALVAVIVVLAVAPGLVLDRIETSTEEKVTAACEAGCPGEAGGAEEARR